MKRRANVTALSPSAAVALALLALAAPRAEAEDLRVVRSGRVFLHFNVGLLRDLGLEIAVAGATPAGHDEILEEPAWAFPIAAASDFRFRTEHGIALPAAAAGGAVRLEGVLTFRDRATGRETPLGDLRVEDVPGDETSPPGRSGTPPLRLRSASADLVVCELVHSMFDFEPKDGSLEVHYLNARLTEAAAKAIGRPEAAGWYVGMAELRASTVIVSSTPPATPPYEPVFAGGTLDVGLGALDEIQQVAHAGIFPNGTAALSMATTICNVGDVDVPWLAPMQENHPLIHMALYRLLNGRFEQIGVSWMKHGFFAESNSECSTCLHPSNGTFLGVGCSDTYSVMNNSDRNFLGPRGEVNAYTGAWTCTGSHFSGGVADCTRRHTSPGHGVLDHRLIAADADLANPGASYFYEAYYVVRDDADRFDNWGSRACTMSWSGSVWSFATPSAGNPLVGGPAVGRWGERSSTVDAATGDGPVTLSVQTTALGGGRWHYEYALLNMRSDRQIRSFSLPIAGVANVGGLGFHDSDGNAGNDWTASIANGVLTWQTQTYAQNPNANALAFGSLFNFRFDADAPPVSLNATLGLFKPGAGTQVVAATRGPTDGVLGADAGAPAAPRLLGIRPNPTTRGATVSFELATGGPASLEVYDAAGRLVRALLDASMGPGSHGVVWDGRTQRGARAPAGVYRVRLRAAGAVSERSLVLVD